MKTTSRLQKFLAAAAIAIFASSTTAGAENWRAYTYNTVATVPPNVGLQKMFDTVKEKTKGDLNIDLFLGGTLSINATNITAAVADNIVQIGDDGFFTGNVPIGNVLRLPFLIDTLDQYKTAEEIVRPYFEKAYNNLGVEMIGQYTYAPAVFFSRKPLKSLDDIKGMKIRAASAEQSAVIQKFGGTPVTLGTPEVAQAVDRGVVDGAITVSGTTARIWADVFKYRYQLQMAFTNAPIIANKAAFDKLSPEAQKIVKDAASEAGTWITNTLNSEEDEMTEKLVKEHGFTNTVADEATMERVRKEFPAFWEEWAAKTGPEAQEVLAKVRAAIGK